MHEASVNASEENDAVVAGAPDDSEAAAGKGVAAPKRGTSPRALLVWLLVAIVVIGGVLYGALVANGRWGSRAMVATAIAGIEALIEGDADGLAAVSNDAVKAQLTTSVRVAMRNSGILVDFAEPEWSGDSAVVKFEGGMGTGTFYAEPATDGANVVLYRTMGAAGYTEGALSLERTREGWAITGLTVAATDLPGSDATTSSVEPTEAP